MNHILGGMPPFANNTPREAYDQVFARERARDYPMVDAFEARAGYAVDRDRLLAAARLLACPVKANPPNWQHGRVLYAAARQAFAEMRGRVMVLDIGTAKGFSALCVKWALDDAGVAGQVVSVDVIDPRSRDARNTVGELAAPRTLTELLEPWPEAAGITFLCSTGIAYLEKYAGRIEFAFVDGKHTAGVVFREGELLAARQQPGDVVIFDDVHLPDIRTAVSGLAAYAIEWLTVLPNRAYAIARRK